MSDSADAVVIGSGPNGLAAAIVIAQAGHRVLVVEAAPTIGGGMRSLELTLPGFIHDLCSAVHPLAAASPFLRNLPLAAHGLEWIEPRGMFAHPLDHGTAGIVYRSLEQTVSALGDDGHAYRRVIGSVVRDWPRIEMDALGPLGMPRHPLTLARFGMRALQPAERLARTFVTDRARGLFAGIAAHCMLPLDRLLTGGVGLVLGAMAHIKGWVMPRGGAQSLANAMANYLRSLGGEIRTATPVESIDQFPHARAILCDLSPRPFLRIAGHRLPPAYKRALESYRYGVGIFKVDWALDAPIPWRSEACSRAGTVHVGGTLEQIAASERDGWEGRHSDRPFTLLVQPTLFDPSRAPAGKHVGWAYCHVPAHSTFDMLPRIEQQIERFAPGFRDRILARHVMTTDAVERYNPNFVGGDISAGVADITQFFNRPTWRTYSTPLRHVFLCSAATPPGVGVHGMCGYFAAKRALGSVLGGPA